MVRMATRCVDSGHQIVLACVEDPHALTVGIENVFKIIMYGHSLGSHKEFEHVIVINKKKTVVSIIEASELLRAKREVCRDNDTG